MAKSSSSKKTPKSDERNIVSSGSSSAIDLDDQIAVIWEQNKNFIFGSIAAVFVAFFAYHAFGYLTHRAEESKKEGYQAAMNDAAKLAWANEESGHPLSGFAFKELADKAFETGDFSTAANHYAKAADSASGVIAEAAKLGEAMALLKLDQISDAKAALTTLADNEEAANQVEALYRLAEIEYSANNYDAVRDYISRIQDKPSQEAFYWVQKALTLQMQLPNNEESNA